MILWNGTAASTPSGTKAPRFFFGRRGHTRKWNPRSVHFAMEAVDPAKNGQSSRLAISASHSGESPGEPRAAAVVHRPFPQGRLQSALEPKRPFESGSPTDAALKLPRARHTVFHRYLSRFATGFFGSSNVHDSSTTIAFILGANYAEV